MKTRYLFPHKFKIFGWILLFIGLLAGTSYYIFDLTEIAFFDVSIYTFLNDGVLSNQGSFSMNQDNILSELITIILLLGGIIVAFSKTKIEDELIGKIRMESLVLATYINYIILILAVLLVYGLTFLNVLTFNMFTLLVFFVIIFHYKLFKLNRYEK